MLKTIFIPLVVGILSFLGFISSTVSLDLNLPETANAGEEFLVEVTINKGDIDGFARFEQELPVGFKAEARQIANGEFRFEDQKIKIQWMRVPYDREVVISYAIQVAPTVSGTFNLEGKFSYIENNSIQKAFIPAKTITIIGDETLAGTAESAQTTYSYQNVSLKNIDCIRQKPYLNENNEVIVNLMVNKGDLRDFGKIQEQIPRGYRAESIKSKNSIFTFKNSIIKFLWMNMPPESQFVVSYKLIPEGEIPDQAFLISGTFSYAENERTTNINIAERAVDLAAFAADELVAQTTTPEPKEPVTKETTPELNTDTYSDQTADNTNNNTEVVNNQTEITQPDLAQNTPVETKSEINTQEQQENTENYMNNLAGVTDIPLPDNGVTYRVQIAAGHNLVGKEYFKKLNITDDVQVEIHEGWHKYTIGNFMIYHDARDYRQYVWNNTPIHDAFVAAYNSGLRITVQEALMIANQKWYK
jgi:hypothetical protein